MNYHYMIEDGAQLYADMDVAADSCFNQQIDARILLATLGIKTPALILDLGVVRERARQLFQSLGGSIALRYAVKCNPSPRVLSTLANEGISFEIASLGELDLVARVGADLTEVVFSSPSKRVDHLASAVASGIRWFTIASRHELAKLASLAHPATRPLLRLRVGDSGSHWPQSPTWGVAEDELIELATEAEKLGFPTVGVMFHVGSQAVPGLWAAALTRVGAVMAASPIQVELIDVGGGFPVAYGKYGNSHLPTWRAIGLEIAEAAAHLPYQPARWIAEPGRSIVADAGTIYTSVVDVDTGRGFVHTDVGAFNGMYEASPSGGGLRLDWSWFDRDASVVEPMQIGGISCDSADVIATSAPLPVDIAPGELLAVRQAGAYSISYASDFCGLSPPSVLLIDGPSASIPPYSVALPGTAAFDEAVNLEQTTFERAGYLEPDGSLSGFRRYDPVSRFLITRADDSRIGSAIRTADASPLGFALLHKLPISGDGWDRLSRIGLDNIVEIVTLSSARTSMSSSFAAYAACWFDIRTRGREHALAAIDVDVLRMIERRLGLITHRLGPPVDYMGSPTVAVLFDLRADQPAMRRLRLGSMLAKA